MEGLWAPVGNAHRGPRVGRVRESRELCELCVWGWGWRVPVRKALLRNLDCAYLMRSCVRV